MSKKRKVPRPSLGRTSSLVARARIEALESMLFALVRRMDDAENRLSCVVVDPGDHMIEAARALLGPGAPKRVCGRLSAPPHRACIGKFQE